MASKIKYNLAKNFYDAFRPRLNNFEFEDVIRRIGVQKHKKEKATSWLVKIPESSEVNVDLFKNSQQELFESKTISDISYENICGEHNFEVHVPVNNFIKDVLESNPTSLNFKPTPKRVVVDFSSPNIAKPFHLGHLRSTAIGNYLANLKKKMGNEVFKINYLGDWGTQLGVLQLGIEEEKYTLEELKNNPIKLLFNAYVKGHKIVSADDEAQEKARKIFNDLENGDEHYSKLWNQYKTWTVQELNTLYARLGIEFDEYAWESDYDRRKADKVLELLEEQKLLSVDEKGRKIATINDLKIVLIKSDNSTLYLTRDLMAVIDRKEKYRFDELYYVVENGQSEHFFRLFHLCDKLGLNQNVKMEHVKFGLVRGMSTRKGNVIFLKDILDEAQERVYERQTQTATTKIQLDNTKVSDIVGVSAVIVNDLKHRRKIDYEASWNDMLQMTGNSGVFLHYCYCRLTSLKKHNSRFSIPSECDPEVLNEPEAVNLVAAIAKYEEILLRSEHDIEASVLVQYLFYLAKMVNAAFKTLNVKNSHEHLASQRLLLFEKARLVLEDGLKLLGITPLTEM